MLNTGLRLLSLLVVCFHPFNMQNLAAQKKEKTDSHPFFLGINPSVTVEPEYQKGEMDINIFPLVYQYPISNRIDFRVNPILNLGIRKSGNSISHFGFETAFPIFLNKQMSRPDPVSGFYIAPVFSASRNRMDRHSNLGAWVEPGYHLVFPNRLAMSFGLQFGATYFDHDQKASEWGPHFGFKFIFGKWFH